MTRFEGNCATSVVRQGKYRIVQHGDSHAVQVIIETPDGMRLYPASREHPELAKMVNAVKNEAGASDGGQFYINEYRQVIVPAGSPTDYFYAGEYASDIVLTLDDEEFSGRSHDAEGNLLKPGDPWTGHPRPGIKYKLKAGGADIEYAREVSPGRERIVRLSQVVGVEPARQTARKIAAIRGNKGGPFYVNEYRAIFGPKEQEDGWTYVFVGTLSETDPWFGKWTPDVSAPSPTASAGKIVEAPVKTEPDERSIEIEDGAQGYPYDLLFADHLRGAKEVVVDDTFMSRSHQVANFLRLSELLVRLGTIRKITLVTKETTDDTQARLETVRRSLEGAGVTMELRIEPSLHDRCIRTDTGWNIHLGRGLDIYKRPETFSSVGATDFALRPCYKTTIVYQRDRQAAVA